MKKMLVHNLKTVPSNAALYFNNNGSDYPKLLEIRKAIMVFCEQPSIKKSGCPIKGSQRPQR
jgi:hypothetical protein